MLENGINSTSALRSWNPVASLNSFSIPKSPLRGDGARVAGRDAPRTLASDSFETTSTPGPLALTAVYPAPAQPLSSQPPGLGLPQNREQDKTGSDLARDGLTADGGDGESGKTAAEGTDDAGGEDGNGKPGQPTNARGEPLSESEQAQLDKLKSRDQEVRQHEQAHKSVGGSYAGSISYDYQQGPDGKRYAVGGEVSIDVSPEKDAAATAAKMRQVRAAAMAPAQPSAQDNAVAAEAARLETQARQDMSRERMEKTREAGEGDGESSGIGVAAEGTTDNAGTGEAASAAGKGGAAPAPAGGASAADEMPQPSPGAVGGTGAGPFAQLANGYGPASTRGGRLGIGAYTPIDVVA